MLGLGARLRFEKENIGWFGWWWEKGRVGKRTRWKERGRKRPGVTGWKCRTEPNPRFLLAWKELSANNGRLLRRHLPPHAPCEEIFQGKEAPARVCAKLTRTAGRGRGRGRALLSHLLNLRKCQVLLELEEMSSSSCKLILVDIWLVAGVCCWSR